MRKAYAITLVLGFIVGAAAAAAYPMFQGYQGRRSRVIGDMNSLIEESVEAGEYKCCIEPACDMCFLGHWMWEDGVCRCDELMREGRFDSVCPQCLRGVEEGRCKSSEEDGVCPVPEDFKEE